MAASQTKKGTVMFTIDGWGNVTIVIHLDRFYFVFGAAYSNAYFGVVI